MLASIMRSYAILFNELPVEPNPANKPKESNPVVKFSLSEVQFFNLLGDEVGVEIRDSVSDRVLLSLSPKVDGGAASAPLNLLDLVEPHGPTLHPPPSLGIASSNHHLHNNSNSNSNKNTSMKFVNVHWLGALKEERAPLLHLPFNLSKAKAYHLNPVYAQPPKRSVGSTAYEESSRGRPLLLEPIVEEIYQNQRYDPLLRTWRPPYLFGDPYEWTDASGKVKDMAAIDLLTSESSCKCPLTSLNGRVGLRWIM